MSGDNLLFINQGIGYKDHIPQSYFIPYFVLVDKNNGKIACNRSINTPLYPVLDYIKTDSLVFLLNENEIMTYSSTCMLKEKSSGSIDAQLRQKTGKFQFFLKKQTLQNIYLQSPSSKNQYENLSKLAEKGAEYFLRTENGVVCLDRNMHSIRWIPETDLLMVQARFNGKCLIGSAKKYITKRILIDEKNNGEMLFQVNLLYRSEVKNGYFFFYPDKSSVAVFPLSVLEQVK